MWTVQAPHWAMPQPYLVPWRPTTSRIAHNRGMSGSASSVVALPLSVKVTDMMEGPHIGMEHLCREPCVVAQEDGISDLPAPCRLWTRDWRGPITSKCDAGMCDAAMCDAAMQELARHQQAAAIHAAMNQSREFARQVERVRAQLTSATPSFSRIAPTNRANSAAALARGASAPQIGFGQSGSVLQRATMWM